MQSDSSNSELSNIIDALDYILCRFVWRDGIDSDLIDAAYEDPLGFEVEGRDHFLVDALQMLNGREFEFLNEIEKHSIHVMPYTRDQLDAEAAHRTKAREMRHEEFLADWLGPKKRKQYEDWKRRKLIQN